MKSALLICSVFVVLLSDPMAQHLYSQQTEFVIGGDWMKQPPGQQLLDSIPLQWWQRVKDAGIRWVSVYTDTVRRDLMARELGMANDLQMTVIPGHTFSGNELVANGYRWRYHPEYSGHFTSIVETGRLKDDANAEKDADGYDDDFNSVEALINTHSQGYLCRGLIPQDIDTTGRYHVRLKLRLPDAPLDTSLQVVRVKVYDHDSLKFDLIVTGGHLKRTPITDGVGISLASNNQYGEVYVGDFYRYDTTAIVNIEVEWLGEVSCILDYVAIDNDEANELFSGNYDPWHIDHEIDSLMQVNSGSRIGRFKSMDEPRRYQWLLVGYYQKRVAHKTNNQKNSISWIMHSWKMMQFRAMLETGQPQHNVDIYPVFRFPTRASLSNQAKMDSLQWNLDVYMSQTLDSAASIIKTRFPNQPLWYTPQIHSWDDIREPANDEIRALVNMSLCYGAKTIYYFAIHGPEFMGSDSAFWLLNRNGTPRTCNSYGENKYAGITAINQKLSILGPHLVNLRWQDAFSRHKEDEDFPNTPPQYGNFEPQFKLLDTLKINRLRTYDQQGRMDKYFNSYVEVGWLRNPNDTTEFIYVTNRRVLDNGGRTITIGFNGTENLAYKDMYSKNIDVISVNADSLQVTLDPGDGTLLRIDSARWKRNEIVEETLTIHPKATLRIAPGYTLTVSDTGTVLIKDSATLILEKGSNLAVNRGGRFLFEGPNSKLILAGDDTISGGGSIVNANIILRGDIRFHIPEGDTLKFQGGGKLECDEYYDPDSSRLVILGHVRFEDAGDEYQFGWCIDSIHVDDGTQQIVSIFETAPGVTLSFLPNIVSWQQGRMYGRGNTSDSSRWQFRNEANCDVYGHLIGSHTIFEASPLDSIPSWDGILVAYENSLIQLDSCYLHQIRVHPSSGGSAIHFYQSLSFDNRINNCIIRRIAGQGYGEERVRIQVPVKLRVFDLLGREVARLVDGWQQEGTYAEVFNASRLPSGVYVYVLSTPYSHVSGRLLLMK